jgi:hypothetical protein
MFEAAINARQDQKFMPCSITVAFPKAMEDETQYAVNSLHFFSSIGLPQ